MEWDLSTADFPARTAQEEDEAEAELVADRLLEEPLVEIQEGALQSRPELLILAYSPESCALLQHAFQEQEIIGTVIFSDEDLTGNCLAPSLSDKSAFVRSAGNGVLTIQCQYEVQEERANAWTKAVFSKLEPKRVLVVGKLKVDDLKGGIDPFADPVLYGWTTSHAVSSNSSSVEKLPRGNLIRGLPAALMLRSEISGIPGYALVDFESPAGPSSKSIQRLASALSEICVPMGAKIQPVGKEHILPSVARAQGPLFV
ncbi:hypothetical protein BSKO_12574 [Bryopsis sp. KO-2023]|nr:hypothetical protein BSKO_12574 [Bryopsis sp. KO-2023]